MHGGKAQGTAAGRCAAIQALSLAIIAGVTHAELGGEACSSSPEPQASSSSLESTSGGVEEPSEGGEGERASSTSGQQPSGLYQLQFILPEVKKHTLEQLVGAPSV